MKIIVKHTTVAKAATIVSNMDKLWASLTDSAYTESQHYSDPVKEFEGVRKTKVRQVLGKAARFTNSPEAKEMTIEVNPAFVEDVLGAAETFTTTVYTVVVPAVKVYNDRLKSIHRKYKL